MHIPVRLLLMGPKRDAHTCKPSTHRPQAYRRTLPAEFFYRHFKYSFFLQAVTVDLVVAVASAVAVALDLAQVLALALALALDSALAPDSALVLDSALALDLALAPGSAPVQALARALAAAGEQQHVRR